MALPSCRRCGKQNPQRMHGLMSLWFAPLIELEADLGYFYLCPGCHDEVIIPELERIQNRILELHPAAQRALDADVVPDEVPDPGGAEVAPGEPDASSASDGEDPPPEGTGHGDPPAEGDTG